MLRNCARWLEANVPEAATVPAFPGTHHKRLGTSNPLEHINNERRRRTG